MDINKRLEEMYEEIGQATMEVGRYDSTVYGKKAFAEEYGFTDEQADEVIQNYKEMKAAQAERYTEEGKKAFEENTDPKYTILKKIRYTKNKYIDGVKAQALTKILKQIKPEEIDDNLIQQLDDTGCDVKQILNGLLNNDMYLFGRDELRGSIEKVQTMYNAFEVKKAKSEEEKTMPQQNNQKQGNFFSRLFDRVKKMFGRSKTKMLPEGTGMEQASDNVATTNKTQRESFVEELQSRASNSTPVRRTARNDIEQESDRLSNFNPIRQNDDNDLEL